MVYVTAFGALGLSAPQSGVSNRHRCAMSRLAALASETLRVSQARLRRASSAFGEARSILFKYLASPGHISLISLAILSFRT